MIIIDGLVEMRSDIILCFFRNQSIVENLDPCFCG